MAHASRLRVAVLSFWHVHAADYATTTTRHPGTELVAVWDDDQARGQACAEEFGVEFSDDLSSLLGRADIDAVVVTTATSQHHTVMLQAARAGKHIFTEKLLAPTASQAEAIVATCHERGVKLMVSLPRLYHGYTQAVQEVLRSGAMGTITYSRVRLSHDGGVAKWLPERFYDRDATFGLAIADLGCHPVYLTQLLLGSRPKAISATYTAMTDHPVEDNAVVTVTYDGGAIGVIESGVVSPDPFVIEIGGHNGWLSYSDGNDFLELSLKDEQTSHIPIPADLPSAFNQWVGHIDTDTYADDNLARAIELTRLVVAANHAAGTGRTEAYR